jgi:argonaute-like protein implicated in RNA metabolism and viral defense
MDTADSLQLISIIIAINALIISFFLWWLDKDSKNLKNNMIATENHARYLDRLTNELVEWMISKEVFERAERGMIHAALESLGKNAHIDNFTKVMYPKRLVCKRNLQHLMLYSRDKTRRDSAHKQLVNAYGNVDTLKIMEDLAKIIDHGEVHHEAILGLRSRINDTLSRLVLPTTTEPRAPRKIAK